MSHDLYRQLAFNGSGYYDGTAYKAIKEADKMNEPLCADIWTIQKQNGTMAEVLILAKHERYVTVLTLTDKEPDENAIKIRSISNKYTDAGKISYAFMDTLCDFVKSLKAEEFDKVLRKVADVLGLSPAVESAPIPAQEPVTDPQPQLIPFEEKAGAKSGQMINDLRTELAVTQKERDIYKDLFTQAMQNLKIWYNKGNNVA